MFLFLCLQNGTVTLFMLLINHFFLFLLWSHQLVILLLNSREEIEIPFSIIVIRDSTFYYCLSLVNVTIPPSVFGLERY